jgi:hypothetical protein
VQPSHLRAKGPPPWLEEVVSKLPIGDLGLVVAQPTQIGCYLFLKTHKTFNFNFFLKLHSFIFSFYFLFILLEPTTVMQG